jgi:MFS family permease
MTPEVINYSYPGSGTNHHPYLVDWIPGDPRNPYNLPTGTKWGITMIMAFGALAVSLSSTAFAGTIPQVQQDFDVSSQLAVASISLFVLGFAIGPMTWAPISETYGRQVLYGVMFTLVTAFGAAAIASPNIGTLLVMRFFAGAFGASSIANSAAVIFDIFVAKERGLAMMMYTSAPFLGPTLGPICGGFLGQYAGWKWVDAFTAIFTGVMLILGVLFVPETYTPHLLNRRARKLSKTTGKIYKSKLEAGQPEKTVAEVLKIAITRPWAILFFEPIVLSITIYSSIGRHPHWIELPSCLVLIVLTLIVYGILYLIFTAFPIVFQGERHWSQGMAGLSYLGVMAGQIVAMLFYVFLEARYRSKIAKDASKQTPEGRLEPAMIGGVLLPAGLFWFGWTTFPSIHWIVSIAGSSLFGFGQVLLFIGLINYIVDTYSVFAASALAANAILRALFAAAL